MKESVTKFDFEAAFKALDEIDVPSSCNEGVKANRPALTEIFSRKTKFDALFEEYYDISSSEELGQAKEDREAEVAKAKLERIEKIVDLDAQSPEDLLTSYVGKYIMQCPQCMTLFYKDKEDVVESEDDHNTVNVNEVCQHCGNESGYTLVGKVGEAEAEEELDLSAEEIPTEELPVEEPTEEDTEESTDEAADELGDLEALDLDLDLEEPAEEEKKEESFIAHTGEALVEDVQEDKDLDAKLEAHNEYIEYLRTVISEEEAALEKATNEQVKAAIQRRIDAFKADLEAALPDAVKNDIALEEPVEEVSSEEATEEVEESCNASNANQALTEGLKEEADLEVSADEFEELINSPEFKKPISDTAVRAMMNAEKEAEDREDKKDVEEALTEGGLKDLGQAIGKKVKQAGKAVKDKVSAAIDKFADNANTREEKADWILKNAVADGITKISLDDDGNVVHTGQSQRFKTFLVIGFKGYLSSGEPITTPPAATSISSLVIGMPEAQARTSYQAAEALAKGWSSQATGGPAFIYLAKSKNDDNALFLCTYFQGNCANDQLDKYFGIFKKDTQAKVQMADAGGISDSTANAKEAEETEAKNANTAAPTPKAIVASSLKAGENVKLGNDIAEVIGVTTSRFGNDMLAVQIKSANGGTETINVNKAAKVITLVDTNGANESFSNKENNLPIIMENLDELQENVLESLIADSLVETYGNVAGFKLNECAYLNNNLAVNGTIYFTSGNKRKTTYMFTEGLNDADGKVSLHGLNEKLGLDKQFVLTGSIKDKTLITESFKCNK